MSHRLSLTCSQEKPTQSIGRHLLWCMLPEPFCMLAVSMRAKRWLAFTVDLSPVHACGLNLTRLFSIVESKMRSSALLTPMLPPVQGYVEAGVHGGMEQAFELLTREEYIAIMTNLVRIQGRVGTETTIRVGLEVLGDQKAGPFYIAHKADTVLEGNVFACMGDDPCPLYVALHAE